MEERHAANDWVGKIHNEIHRAIIGDINSIEPYWILHCCPANIICQKVDLVDVKRMDLSRRVDHAPALKRTDIYCQHRAGIHFEFSTIYIEALFVFSEGDNELRFAGLHPFENCF